jgi:hypothetical protein
MEGRMALGLLGFAAVFLSLLMGLWMEHVRERPVYERPAIMIRSLFSVAWGPARWLLLAAGLILLSRASLAMAASLAALLILLRAWKGYLGSRRHRHRMIRAAFEKERTRDPAASDRQILQRILHSLHARWGEELIEQIVADNPTPEGVADMVVRMERGVLPSGFHPSRILRGGR